MNKLYFGDNLTVLRENFRDEIVDLIYLDPPFNSKANYNVLFKTPAGHDSGAQIQAFKDTWHWNEQAEREFEELVHCKNTQVSAIMQALRIFLGENDMMAYLTMMANRLLELHRVLKPTGSLYLHCDPTTSHYLKIVLDGVFGKQYFLNEIIWHYRRWTAGSKKYQKMHDVLFFYSKNEHHHFDMPFEPYGDWIKTDYRYVDEESGKRWRWHTVKGKRYKVFLEDENRGVKCNDVWLIPYIGSTAKERLGYPTQKPLALLERIVQASSKENDIVLDPFCGCGTTVHAAQKLNRRWIGIDITHLAISLIEKRIQDAFPNIDFEVEGTPKDLEGATDLSRRDKYQFQWWACSLVGAQPYQGKKKGADGGIDGLIYFNDGKKTQKIIVSVKGGDNVSVAMVRDLAHVVEREKATIGLFITLAEPTKPMNIEAVKAGFYEQESPQRAYPRIQILTIKDLLTGHKRAEYPSQASYGQITFKRTQREEKTSQDKLL